MIGRTPLAKVFNAIASLGLGLCLGAVPLFGKDQRAYAVVILCVAMIFAGKHLKVLGTVNLNLPIISINLTYSLKNFLKIV